MAGDVLSYEVTPTGPEDFQVSVVHPVYGTHLVETFSSLQAAQTFAATMRTFDAGPSYGPGDYRTDMLIRRNRELIAAASKARSDSMEKKVEYASRRAMAAAMRARW